MLKTYAHQFVEINHTLELVLLMLSQIVAGNDQYEKQGKYPQYRAEDRYKLPEIYKMLDDSLSRVKVLCEELNLRAALEHIKRFDDERPYRDDRFGSLANLVREVRQRIEDELKSVQFLFVPLSKTDYYDRPIFGTEVENRFTDAIDDIREAGNCFALGRWTGVVHHCMGIMQVALAHLAKHLEIEIDIYVDDWNNIITKIEGAIKRLKPAAKDVTSEWKQVEPFYSEIVSDIRAIKDAWRNPTAHFRRQYDEMQAKKVLERVGDFIRNLADKLPQETV